MPKYNLYCQVIIVAMLLTLPTRVGAQDIDLSTWTDTREQWGRALFCKHIYQLPEVKSRLYDFDVERCDKAVLLLAESVNVYSEQQQAQLKNQAERHAFLLRQNTSEPYHSVPACRDYCTKVGKAQDQKNDR